jgi:hypothetical protein
MEEPFEPMDRASLKNITLKTVFLVALATAQRKNISFNKERGRSNWHPCQASWRRTRHLNTFRRPVIIHSLSASIDKTFPDRTLCPVRALMFYVDRTRPPTVRRGRQHLFISYVEGYSKDIAPATISRWIVSTIKLAYQLTGNSQSLLRLSRIWTAH